MSTQTPSTTSRAAAPEGATCRGRGGECDRETQLGDLCLWCVYDEIVLEDPTICRRCFRRTHHIELVSTNNRYAAAGGDLEWDVDEDGIWRLEGEIYFRTHETDRDVPPPKREGERAMEQTVCVCGDYDGAARETLSRKHALEHAERLSQRLDELEIDHEPEQLLDRVDDLKHEPETAGKDQPVFREAVAQSIQNPNA